MTIARQLYVISDLHLGGAPPDATSGDPVKQRGFRMMKHPDKLADFIVALANRSGPAATELVINGDFVDFLAEEHTPGRWTAFRYAPPRAAVEALETVMDRASADGPVFDALRQFVTRGHTLTVLVGNHDLEMSLPEVRAALSRRVGGSIRWMMDGEALTVGDAVIEHGNAYDLANAVDLDGLRKLRALRSRRQYDLRGQEAVFSPPMGSRLVAEIMNPLKREYAFVDLLKPESEPLFALILALAPEKRGELEKLAKLLPTLARPAMPRRGVSAVMRNVTAEEAPPPEAPSQQTEESSLAHYLSGAMDPDVARALVASSGGGAAKQGARLAEVSASTWITSKLGLLDALLDESDALSDARLEALRWAFRALEEDETWEVGTETGRRYRKAARALMEDNDYGPGFRYVVFGHTHHAKRLELREGGWYLNTGTWANLMRFPPLAKDRKTALDQIRAFVAPLKNNTAPGDFVPTYVRLDVRADDKIDGAHLCFYDPKLKKVE